MFTSSEIVKMVTSMTNDYFELTEEYAKHINNRHVKSNRAMHTSKFRKGSNLRSKSAGWKRLEQITELFNGFHCTRFVFMKATHRFLLFVASGRLSSKKGIACRPIPFSKEAVLLQPPRTHLPGILEIFWLVLSQFRTHCSLRSKQSVPAVTSQVTRFILPLILGRGIQKSQFFVLWKFIEK